jgi:hypothetical protein
VNLLKFLTEMHSYKQVEQFLMSHKQKQQQQFATPGGMNHGGYQPIGGIHNMGFANTGASDASLGRLGVVSQASGTIRAAAAGGIGFGRAPGPLAGAPGIGAPLHGLEVPAASTKASLHVYYDHLTVMRSMFFAFYMTFGSDVLARLPREVRQYFKDRR